jgi:hypothetical protein
MASRPVAQTALKQVQNLAINDQDQQPWMVKTGRGQHDLAIFYSS